MSIVITKTKLAIAVIALALIVPATAIATHSFSDVDDSRFYHDAVEWALDNGITVGCNGGTGFCGEDNVTRGENITFAQRYDTNVVQPALDELSAAAGIVAFDHESSIGDWDGSEEEIDVELTVPTAGYAIVTYSSWLGRDIDETGSGMLDVSFELVVNDDSQTTFEEVVDLDPSGDAHTDEVVSYSYVVPVVEGENVIEVLITHGGDPGDLVYVYEQSLNALFVPTAQMSSDPVIIVPLGSGMNE